MTDHSRRTFIRHLLGGAALLAAETSTSSELAGVRGIEERAEDVVTRAHELLIGLHARELTPFLDEWPTVLQRRPVVPSPVPVLRWLPRIQVVAPEFSAQLVSAVVAAAPFLAWRRSYSAAEVGSAFFDRYGWTELVGLTGPVADEHLACGLLLLGPRVTYPRHRHEAEEIYVPLAGTALWKGGDDRWLQRPPGSVIHHARHEPHAMRTGQSPLLALYLWRSANLAQKSHLDRAPEPT
jgi:hypothetical protein